MKSYDIHKDIYICVLMMFSGKWEDMLYANRGNLIASICPRQDFKKMQSIIPFWGGRKGKLQKKKCSSIDCKTYRWLRVLLGLKLGPSSLPMGIAYQAG